MATRVRELDELCQFLGDVTFDRPPAIVCNAHVTGLSVARALDRHDVPVIAIDRSDDGVAPYSDAVDVAGIVTYPLDDLDGFREDVEQIADQLAYEPVAFGCMDEWVHAFADARPEGVRLPFAAEATAAVLNKESLYATADALDVPYPETYRLEGIGGESVVGADRAPELRSPDAAADQLGFPLIIKPARKRAFEEAIGTNVIEVETEDEYADVLAAAADAGVRVMAQRSVDVDVGEDRSLASYRSPDGDQIGIVGNARVRYPRGFGTSCVVDRVDHPIIRERGRAVLAESGYHGISEAEFVRDRKREEFLLLDVNTRPWKWIDLPVTTGVNLPYAAYADAVGAKYEADDPHDARWVFLKDYLSLLAEDAAFTDVLTPDQRTDLISGAFEGRDSLTTGVFRPSDPDPTRQLLATAFSTREYYCDC